jgi:serine-type D-Ala-D-Ala carboxypeptidase (penicillin-binding protein 5/6)
MSSLRRLLIALVLVATGAAETALVLRPDDGAAVSSAATTTPSPTPSAIPDAGTATASLAVRLDDPHNPVSLKFQQPPTAGLLFNIDTGQVLWRRNPYKQLPIASLTKMMTALVVNDQVPPGSTVKVTKQALAYQGSGVGELPLGKWIGVNTMLYGLLLPSGNDAAIALAQRAAKTVPNFIKLMNQKAQSMGLGCTHYATPSGFTDAHNHSCAADLAKEARAILAIPRLAKIVGTANANLPFPIKGGHLWLRNNNPLLEQGYPGTTGMKTGFTDAAGLCLVGTATHDGVRLGVVLLHTPNWGTQSAQLLNAGFKYMHVS